MKNKPADNQEKQPDQFNGKVEEVYREYIKLNENKKYSKLLYAIILLINIYIFYSFGLLFNRVLDIMIIALVILIHEAGHLISMKIFKYANIHMLIIPLVGAAAMGDASKRSSAKKAVVALMGPAPGVLISWLAYVLYMKTGAYEFYVYSGFSLAINGFNLLPVYPLDGGHYWEDILFSRNPVTEIVFRVGMALLIFIISLYVRQPLFIFFSAALLMAMILFIQPAKIIKLMNSQQNAAPENKYIVTKQFIANVLSNIDNSERASARGMARLVKVVHEKINSDPMKPPMVVAFALAYFLTIFAVVYLAEILIALHNNPLI